MPIYTYQCKECDYEFEDIVKHKNRTRPRTCPECKGKLAAYKEEATIFTYSLQRSFSRMRHGK